MACETVGKLLYQRRAVEIHVRHGAAVVSDGHVEKDRGGGRAGLRRQAKSGSANGTDVVLMLNVSST